MPRTTSDTINRGGTYYFKKRVPKDLVGSKAFGSAKIVQFTLDTKDRSVAMKRAQAARERFQRQVDAARNVPPTPALADTWLPPMIAVRVVPTREQMTDVAKEYRWSSIQAMPTHHDYDSRKMFESDPFIGGEDFVAGRPLSERIDERDRLQANPKTDEIVEDALDLANRYGWDLPVGSDQFNFLCQRLTQARLSALKVAFAATEPEAFDLIDSAVPQRRADKNYTLTAAVDAYCRQKPEKAEMVKKMKAALAAWNDLVGTGSIALIRRGDVARYVDKLKTVPQRSSDRFRGKSLSEAIELNNARKEPFPRLAPKTIKVAYVGMLTAAVGEAMRHEHAHHNPFVGARVEGSNDLNSDRRAFRKEELEAIFSHPIWTGCKDAAHRNTPGSLVLRDHYFWPPLISLFTGMRATEIGELLTVDVHLPGEHDLPHIAVRRGKTKNAVRDIPLHPRLIRLGFDLYVKEIRAAGHKRLFPEWRKPAGDKKYSVSPCQNNFNQVVLHKDRIRAEGLTFHCFRHTLESEISSGQKKQPFDESYRLKIMAHAQHGTKRHYRKPELQEYHQAFIDVVKFAKLDLSHLHPKRSRASRA